MKTSPITAAIGLTSTVATPPAAFGAAGHGISVLDAHRVFMAGCGLPGRWAGLPRFVILATGFGHGHHFLAAWHAWRNDPRRCERLVFLSLDQHPPTAADLARAHATSAVHELAVQLCEAWPPPTPNLHPIDFEHGRVRLILGLGARARLLPNLLADVDAFFVDENLPGEGPTALKQLGRLAVVGATLSSAAAPGALLAPLLTAGFEPTAAPPETAAADVTTARYAPRHRPSPLPGGLHRHGGPREALVVGAGLAGCAAAWALAREGWQVTVLDREAAAARGTSGNPVGLFHGAVHAADGPHARLLRAAALRTARVLAPWIATGRVRGRIDGLLRLAHDSPGPRSAAQAAGWASGHAEAISREQARARAGVAVPDGGWWFGQGGWLVPGDFARALLDDSGARFVGAAQAARIERVGDRWAVFGTDGGTLGHAPVLVLANALQIPSLLDEPIAQALGPLAAARGQISGIPASGSEPTRPALRVPVSGNGYAAPEFDGMLWCGATTQLDDPDTRVRDDDHRHNLRQLSRLLGEPAWAARTVEDLRGRVGWRAVTPDRLPWVGAVPDVAAFERAGRADRVRFVPRLRDAHTGVYLLGALGSRGITWAVLCGELLASWVTGSPCPLEADLRDALDPARRLVAQRRRASNGTPAKG